MIQISAIGFTLGHELHHHVGLFINDYIERDEEIKRRNECVQKYAAAKCITHADVTLFVCLSISYSQFMCIKYGYNQRIYIQQKTLNLFFCDHSVVWVKIASYHR